MPSDNPFLDPRRIRGELYASPHRLATRTSALISARVSGQPVVDVLSELLNSWLAVPMGQARVVDVGCGRGSTTSALAALEPHSLVGLDASPALAVTADARLTGERRHRAVAADFHHLPFTDSTFDAVIAAFCLYHAPKPTIAVTDITRCLRPGGILIAVTKSLDSYGELDRLLTIRGLDPGAEARPSLYEAAHSHNIESLVAPVLNVLEVRHDKHRFQFTDMRQLARYLATTPKYQLPNGLGEDPHRLADVLGQRVSESPVSTSSTVTYLVGARSA